MTRVRKPAVAGRFYPSDPDELRSSVDDFLSGGSPTADAPKAIIAPHAGYPYSGPIAGTAYRTLAERADQVDRVVLLGPSHRVGFEGLAAPTSDAFETPLGDVAIDRDTIDALLEMPQVIELDRAHAAEHSLEVHLPFLQRLLGDFRLVPLVVGHAGPDQVSDVLDRLWGGDETVIVISSDLSHYHDYDTARRLDEETSEAIISLDYDNLDPQRACGAFPIRGLLRAAEERSMDAELLDLRSSGDTAGTHDQVVGYGAYAFRE